MVVVTHPCHPFRGQQLVVRHFRLLGGRPAVTVEMPDGTIRPIPLSWTDRGSPDAHHIASAPQGRLSGLALLELVARLDSWKRGD